MEDEGINLMGFSKYQHVERLGTRNVEGIEHGECYVFPKLDGTNGSIWVDINGELQCGSRNKLLSKQANNAGFWQYVDKNREMFLNYFKKYPNDRLFGEWLVPHTLKTYREDAWRKFYVFDVYEQFITISEADNEGGVYEKPLPYDEYIDGLVDFGVEYIAPIKIVTNGTPDTFYKIADGNTYLMQPGEIGEGIVIKNYNYANGFGRATWAKVVRNEFKENHVKVMDTPNASGKAGIEQKIVDRFLTDEFIEKEFAKIKLSEGGWESKMIPRLLNTVYSVFLDEEIVEIMKKLKPDIVSFRTLKGIITSKIRAVKSELF